MAPTKKSKAAPSSESKVTKKETKKTSQLVKTPKVTVEKKQETSAINPKTTSKTSPKSISKEPKIKPPKEPKAPKIEKTLKTKKARTTAPKEQETLFRETLFKEPVETLIEQEQLQLAPAPTPSVSATVKTEQIPTYSAEEADTDIKKSVSFEKIIANMSILDALKKAKYFFANETLQQILPAALRGSDVLVYKPEEADGFLVGIVTALSRVLNEQIAKGTPHNPSVLFLSSNQEKSEQAFQATQKIFGEIDVGFGILNETNSSEESKSALKHSIDILFATPKSLTDAQNTQNLKLNSVGLCFVHRIDKLNPESFSTLDPILKALPLERVQKIFVSNANSGKIRELAFQYLEDPEYFSLLPSYIKERSPKQFAHALTATQKFQVLLGHLKHHKPQCAVVFANTPTVAEWVAFKLHGNGIKVDLVTSHLYANKRQSLVKSVKAREINVIVTTDFYCKGFGLEDLNCIYHFDIPDSSSKFMDRLNRIEGAKNPISVLFICEDYGFNISRIEETLGFKFHIAEPDRNYFSLKDTSEYPLEPSGRVKRIGQVYETPKKDVPIVSAPKPISITPEQPVTAVAAQISTQPPRLQPRAMVPGAQAPREKFVYRDFKARDAIDSAKQASLAAFEKRKETDQQQPQSKKHAPKEVGLFSFVVTLAGDAVKAAVAAASESISKNMAENQPSFFSFLKKKK